MQMMRMRQRNYYYKSHATHYFLPFSILISREMTSSSSSQMDSDYSVNVVNVNYRTSTGKIIDLQNAHSLLVNSKLHTKPTQLVVKSEKGTVLIFRTGRIRIMGCNDELDAMFLAYTYLMTLDETCNFPPVYAQSMTVKVAFNNITGINLIKYSSECTSLPLQYEPELFPAVLLKKYKPISVNVFSTGKIMMCGVRDIQQVHNIMQEIKSDIDKCIL